MRLLFQNGPIIAQFTVVWELAQLVEYAHKGREWAPLYVEGKAEPVGRIHSQTYEVQLVENHGLQHRQVVRLGPGPQDPQTP